MSLLQKLKSGLGVGESGETEEASRKEPAAPVEKAPAPQPAPAKMEEDMYAPKRGNLDQTGRVTPTVKSSQEDDQLDIPAFLRRQAN